jgi:hypothetical protein
MTYHRIICCQGAAQLASAIASMWLLKDRYNRNHKDGRNFENHLIVHDLYSRDALQTRDFFNSITKLASQVEIWQSCQYISPEEVAAIALSDQSTLVHEQLRNRIGIPECHEVYLSQNTLSLYDLLRVSYPEAKHICFGDGVGFNFTRNYLFRSREAPYPSRSIKNETGDNGSFFERLGETIAPIFQTDLPFEKHNFDEFCLLLPNLFDQRIEKFRLLERQSFLKLFKRFGDNFKTDAPDTHLLLSRINSQSGKTVILLSSNFSEGCLMPRDVELKGYLDLLSQLPQGPNVDLIIKPHPRDTKEKLLLLKQACESKYRQAVALSDPWTFYLPIESLIAKYFLPTRSSRLRRSVHVAAVGTSCITLDYLYGIECKLGFNNNSILEQCSPEWRELRSSHEQDLEQILRYVRRLRSSIRWKYLPRFARNFILRLAGRNSSSLSFE